MKRRITAFDVVNAIFMLLIALITAFPFYQVVVVSFVSFEEYLTKNGTVLFPNAWTFQAYEFIFRTDTFFRSLLNSFISTVAGTALAMLLTVTMAYPLSKPRLKGMSFVSMFIIFPMMFGGGIIPFYLLLRSFRMVNTLWALIVPWCVSTFNIILMKNFIYSLPESLEESAKLDGANELQILFRIIMPLSMPIIATLVLFYGVGYWNDYYRAVLFISKSQYYPIQNLLRQILVDSTLEALGAGMSHVTATMFETSHTIKMAIVVVATVPVLCVYPFLQKYYVKGIMTGAIKG